MSVKCFHGGWNCGDDLTRHVKTTETRMTKGPSDQQPWRFRKEFCRCELQGRQAVPNEEAPSWTCSQRWAEVYGGSKGRICTVNALDGAKRELTEPSVYPG